MEKQNKKPRYYFGIDLGTTNSVLAWADIEQQETEFIEPKVVSIRMPARTNYSAIGYNDWLPSCVYFRGNPPKPIVGTYAKGMLLSNPKNVVKSIKTKMGTHDKIFGCEPPGISAHILTALYNGIYELGFPKDDFLNEVVIGVPASFEKDMCDATLKAAEYAGFKKTILIHEPVAAIYDYSNQQNRGLFPSWVLGIEFSVDKPQLILVFDLGGGTLDVTLHKVSLCNDQKLCVEKIAVSRYTSIGGDNFDSLLAEHFLDIYQERHGILHNRSLLKPQFQEYAEQAKINLSEKIYGEKSTKTFDPKKTKITFRSLDRDGFSDETFDYVLTLCEYEEIIAPLLANYLTLESVATFDPSNPPDNIIDPILDVLQKGQRALNPKEIIIPNAVLLNGAMTKLYTIQKRLETFFPCVIISPIVDPDKAVARGAVIAHYNMYH